MAARPRFNRIYKGEWPYSSSEGVGLRLTNYPTDPTKFREVVKGFGCHPKAANRILARIAEKGYDLLTVMFHLDFDKISELLTLTGVHLEIIPPQPDWCQRFDDGPWEESYTIIRSDNDERGDEFIDVPHR